MPASRPAADMATKPPQSLPSFAQTFGGGPSSINRLPEMNTSLPPIQHRQPSIQRNRSSSSQRPSPQPQPSDTKQNSRKRLHADSSAPSNDDIPPTEDRRSPRTVRIKQEVDYEQLPPSQPPVILETSSITPSAASPVGPNPSKKRRVTISGMSQPINTDVRRPSVDSGISPVVMGFTIMRDDPAALEQVRSMISVKQKQKALIEQRRGSTAGIVTPIAPPAVNIVNPRPGSEEYQAPPPKPPGRGGGRSPNNPSAPRRSVAQPATSAPPPQSASSTAPPNPNPSHVVPSQQPSSAPQHPPQPDPQPPSHTHLHPSSVSNTATSSSAVPAQPIAAAAAAATTTTPTPQPPPPPPSSHGLPPQPISFARRRAGRQLGKTKPADIMISPREPHTEGQLQPLIQSAPPIPRAGQGQPYTSGRIPSMAIPTLPSVMTPGLVAKRVTSGQVPPTPTRLSMRQSMVGATTTTTTGGSGVGGTGRSPPASVPIASMLVPPTPSSLHHSGYTGEKEAFLAPFEMLYNTFSDTRQLKNWLGEQLQKSNMLMAGLQKQQEQIEEMVNGLVDKRVGGMREEVYGLRVRVEELEHQLRVAKGTGTLSSSAATGFSPSMASAKTKGKANGYAPPHAPHAPSSNIGIVPETYTFPPVDPLRRTEPVRRVLSPPPPTSGMGMGEGESRSVPGSQTASPVPFEYGRRLSISAMRLDPPRLPPGETPPQASSSVLHRTGSYSTHAHSHSREGHGFHVPTQSQGGNGGGNGGAGGGVGGKGGGWSPRMHKSGLPTSSTRSSLRESGVVTSATSGGSGGHSIPAVGGGVSERNLGMARQSSGQGYRFGEKVGSLHREVNGSGEREGRDLGRGDRERDRERDRGEGERDREERSKDRERERERGERERSEKLAAEKEQGNGGGSDGHPASSQQQQQQPRRNSIAPPGSAASSSSSVATSSSATASQGQHRGRVKSPVPMDED